MVTKPNTEEIKRDGKFIAYDDGTVLDTETGLMWAAKDNEEDIDWQNAKNYCESYSGGEYSDWRMPTLDELEGLYDNSQWDYKEDNNTAGYLPQCYKKGAKKAKVYTITLLIKLSCMFCWSSKFKEDETGLHGFVFDFHDITNSGRRFDGRKAGCRVLPVRGRN